MFRIATLGVPRFCHDGLVVEAGWSDFDFGGAPPEIAKVFLEHVGRFIRIHPDDVDRLGAFGLALKGGRIVEAPAAELAAAPAEASTEAPEQPAVSAGASEASADPPAAPAKERRSEPPGKRRR